MIDYTKPKPDRTNQGPRQKGGKPQYKGGKNKGNKDNQNDSNNPAYERSNTDQKPITKDKKISYKQYNEYVPMYF